jgi:DNA-binding SARP family transcriptional activator/tetratricopeptide (TPR) repeat protein
MWFGLLGTLQVRIDDREVRVPGVRQRILLAALLLKSGQALPVAQLSELVWDGQPPRRAEVTLRSYVQRLRQALGPQGSARVITTSGGYRVDASADQLDIVQFDDLLRTGIAAAQSGDWERAVGPLDQAQALWRGSPLADIPCQALQLAEVPRLEEQRLQAIQWRMEASLQLGQHEYVTPQLQSLTAEHPLREPFHGQLMVALYRSGRQADALTAYRTARGILVGELGLEPGAELRLLHQRILANDRELLATAHRSPAPAEGQAQPEPEPGPGPRAAAIIIPRQLPAAARSFVGRQAEISALSSLAEQAGAPDGSPGTVLISAISGMAGIGKTALAIHAAHQLAPSFPDGQLYIDLHGYTPGLAPRDPADALAVVLAAYGVPPQQVPEDLDARAALYRSCLAGSRTLVVLDNAATEAQVRPLLPGAGGCLAVITSRRHLKPLDDARLLSLDVLPLPDAVAMFCQVAGLDRIRAGDPLLQEIAELCGRLPLAVCIAGALLRHRPAWGPEHLAGRLRGAQPGLAVFFDGDRDLTTVFGLSYQALAGDQQRLFRGLGLIPGLDVDAYAAAALLETDPVRAERWLGDLVDHNLLTESAPGRYQMHDLIRAYAGVLTETDPSGGQQAARGRLLDYYQHTATRADSLVARFPRPAPETRAPAYPPALPDPAAAWRWLRAERLNLLAAVGYTTTAGCHQRAVALTAGMTTLLRTDGPWAQAVSLQTAAVDIARRLDDQPRLAAALLALGDQWLCTGEFASAQRELEEALKICRDSGDRNGQARALIRLAGTQRLTGEHADALGNLDQAVELLPDPGDRQLKANALTQLGEVREATGDRAAALRDLRKALFIYRSLGDRYGQGRTLYLLGTALWSTGDRSGAIRDLREALELFRELGDRQALANVLTPLGELRGSLGEHPAAARDLHEALELYRALDDPIGLGNVLTSRGQLRRWTGDLPGALRDLSEALTLHRQTGARSNEARTLHCYAAAIATTGDHQQAAVHYQDALRLAREVHQPEDEAVALEGVAECHLADGDIVAGRAFLYQAREIYQRLHMTLDTERVRARLAGTESGSP